MSRSRPYDSGESRRSPPRERSPAPQRYNDVRDLGQQRGAPYRSNDALPRPSSDLRSSSETFSSNRDNFRDGMSRQVTRDHTIGLAPPRAPKAFPDAPTGPRAISYTTDSSGRGGVRGRGRGWHDETRDRGRELEYDYRDRRDSRGAPSFRGDRGRERDWMDRDRRDRDGPGFRGRRPSSPGVGSGYLRGRGRGRGEWDSRGYGRGYDERDRFRGRSRSPPPSRRTSVASPPPQAPEVPEFGSVITYQSASSVTPDNQQAVSSTPVTIPTGPRSTRDPSAQKSWPISSGKLPSYGSVQWRTSSSSQPLETPQVNKHLTKSTALADLVVQKTSSSAQVSLMASTSGAISAITRLPLPSGDISEEDDSDSESGEDMDDFFEAETKKVQDQLAQTSLGDVERSFTYAFQDPVALFPILEPPAKLSDDGNEVERSEPPEVVSPVPQRPKMPAYQSEGDESEVEYQEQLAAVRPRMKTPPRSSLPFKPLKKKWYENEEFFAEIEEAAKHQSTLEKEMAEEWQKKEEHRQNLRKEYAYHYRQYLDFCESDDPPAVNYRAKIAASEKATSRAASLTPAAEGRPEGRRAASRFATEHDIARVIQESKREAQEKQERSERAAKAKAASEKEATIPDMMTLEEYRLENFAITSTLVPFNRAPAMLGILPPIDNFTPEECEIFEKTYLDFPKQWSKIAAILPGRDYKNCIQHYYLVKHKDNLKEKLKKKEKGKKKGRASTAASKPKSNALMANLGSRDGETDDGQDAIDGERRRPRRAAAPIWPIEQPSESETATPAPTPGRRMGSTNKGDTGSESGPTKRKTKSAREKGPKQPKNGQLLAAAPPTKARDMDDTSTLGHMAEKAQGKIPAEPNRFLSQFDGTAQSTNVYPTTRVSHELVAGPPVGGVENMFHGYVDQEYGEPAAASVPFDSQHNDRRNANPTSSYWSVPEQTDFPGLLQHFGTDWHAIAKFMASKTHIMVKNYYQRQVDSGRQDLEEFARIADGRRARGESTGPPPAPTPPIKRRYDGPSGVIQRSAVPTIEAAEELPSTHQPIGMQKAASPKPPTISRFPALAQAGPVPQSSQPVRTMSTSSKPTSSQPQAQWVQQVLQHQQHQRGPQLGYFNAPDRERPVLQAASTQHQQPNVGLSDPIRIQRSEMVAYEAQLERDQAMRLQEQQAREQHAREQQAREQLAREQQAREQQAREQQAREQQARQQRQRIGEQQVRRQQLSLKSETDLQNLNQYEQYSTQAQQPNLVARSRVEDTSSIYGGDLRRATPTHYSPRDASSLRDNDSIGPTTSALMPNPTSQLPRTNITLTHAHQDQLVAPRQQPPAVTAVRQQETVRKTSSIMSLLNSDEPTEPRFPPTKRNSDGPPGPIQPSPSPVIQQPLYPPARSLSGGHPGSLRRKPSIGDMQGPTHSFARPTATSQGAMRVVESPYTAVVQSQAQSRSQTGSALDSQPAADRDSYAHQQYGIQRSQQPTANSPQGGTVYQSAQQTHRQMAFSQTNKRTASPPGQYQPLQASRSNSFEYGHHTTPSSVPAQMHYSPGPAGPPVSLPYGPTSSSQHSLSTVRFPQASFSPSPYETRESFRPGPPQHPSMDRLQAEQQQSQLRQQMLLQQQQQRDEEMYQPRRLEERRYEDSRR